MPPDPKNLLPYLARDSPTIIPYNECLFCDSGCSSDHTTIRCDAGVPQSKDPSFYAYHRQHTMSVFHGHTASAKNVG